MISIQYLGSGKFAITDGKNSIILSQPDYEDIFFACPLDASAMYLLLNQTILQSVELRDILKQIVERHGGINPAMAAIQAAILALDPKKALEPGPPAAPAPAAPEDVPTAEVVTPSVQAAQPVEAAPGAEASLAAKKIAGMHERRERPAPTAPVTEKIKQVKVAREKNGSYTIGFGSQSISLTNEKFRELYFSLPMDTPSIFRLFFTSLLPDVKSKAVFRRMMSMAGGSSALLEKIVKELEKLRAQDV